MYPFIDEWVNAMARADRGLALVLVCSALVLAVLIGQRYLKWQGAAQARIGLIWLALMSIMMSMV